MVVELYSCSVENNPLHVHLDEIAVRDVKLHYNMIPVVDGGQIRTTYRAFSPCSDTPPGTSYDPDYDGQNSVLHKNASRFIGR